MWSRCAEVARFMKLLPEKTVGINWDPLNGTSQNEFAVPDGYKRFLLSGFGTCRRRGTACSHLTRSWTGRASSVRLDRDGYKGEVGLETHYFDGTKIEKSHASMVEIFRILES